MLLRHRHRYLSPDPDLEGGGAPPAADPPAGDPAPPNDPPAGDPNPDPDPAPAGDPPKAGESYWPADWRNTIAGADEKLLQRLGRYDSPKAVADALLSVQSRIGKGELRSVLPKNASEEQLKTWREENGIPEKPDGYQLSLANGLVIADDDKPLIDNILQAVHKAHGNAAVASEVVNFYYEEMERVEAARQAADKQHALAAEAELIKEWGPDFRPNLNMIDGLLDMAPGGIKDLIKYGRLSDGTPIMANTEAIRWLNNLAREINPVTTLIPNVGANISGSIDDEIAKIEKTMRDDRKTYNADDKMQARLRDLYNARERATKKGG